MVYPGGSFGENTPDNNTLEFCSQTMDTIFVIQNQLGHYLSKSKEWTDGRDRRVLYRTPHKDEVINQVFELSSKNIELRAMHLECQMDDNGQPMVEPSATPLPLEMAAGDEPEDSPAPEHEEMAMQGDAQTLENEAAEPNIDN